MKLNTKQKIALASAFSTGIRGCRGLLGLSNVVCTRRNGLNWKLDLREGIDFSIYLLGGFELPTLRLYKKVCAAVRPRIVFDIGANIGAHTLPLAQLLQQHDGRVHAFEPTHWALSKLRTNLALNPALAPVVHAVQAMLVADSTKKVKEQIYSSWPLAGGEGLHAVHCGRLNETTGAIAITLDNYVAQNRLDTVDLIKIDVDGNEPQVLNGAMQTIRQFAPLILMEWSPHLFLDQPEVMKKMLAQLQALDYRIRHGGTGSPIIGGQSELDKLTPKEGSINILFVPARYARIFGKNGPGRCLNNDCQG
ncbi:FkbM family methyltransferase [Thiorhodovibrio frisius]|uniref:Methyltransferase, FkbM family n=1 Tax=Thiorhodovibrio frisius TaxID=631362 RepID=H8Z1S5_9GAMM|nr:FkbM family methyltransferase [Thiorhodovibrio frisius]EIC22553.1 methyltransferase, FkbM family [Thiorhodovibrio frisius]WPL19994.1 methyltransferase, FkbM family [Thiorhodovibrio frisius]